MSRDAVRTYYASFAEREWQRLETFPEGQIEFAVTQDALKAHLPKLGAFSTSAVGRGDGRFGWHTVATRLCWPMFHQTCCTLRPKF